MRVRKEIGYLLLGVIGVASIGISLGAAWLYVRAEPALADQKLEAELLRLQAAGRVYAGRLKSYEGVCRDIGLRAGYLCQESEEAFAVAVERSDGMYFCADNTGHFGEQFMPVTSSPKCARGD